MSAQVNMKTIFKRSVLQKVTKRVVFFVIKRKVVQHFYTPRQLKYLSRCEGGPFLNKRLLKVVKHFNWTSMFDTFYWTATLVFYTLTLLGYPISRKYISSTYFLLANLLSLVLVLGAHCALTNQIFLRGVVFNVITSNLLGSSYTIPLSLSLSLTPLSWSFAALVLVIALATNIYSFNYFKGESREGLFIFWLNFFVLSMLLLIFANNFFTLFLGWEGIGLTSFFLINFWNSRRATLKASFKAFTFNTFSDLCLLFALSVFFTLTGADELDVFLYLCQSNEYAGNLLQVGSLAICFCAATKSVQLGFHTWLPDSMEAPVPASALIHSATLVSAGIYLIIRFHILFLITNLQVYLILWGGLTAFIGGIIACTQTDLKKLLAYSTMSHCGFLWGLAGLGATNSCILYLFLHGLFKASTFFSVGSFIQVSGTQDIRWIRNPNNMLGDVLLLVITSSNLCGLPLTLGYFYKDTMLVILGQSALSSLSVSAYLLGMLSSVGYFLRINAVWRENFNKSVKSDIGVLGSFNKTKKIFGFLQVNTVLAVVFLVFAAAFFIKVWKILGSNLFWDDTIDQLAGVFVINQEKIVPILFYWCFSLLTLTLCFLSTRRSEYTQLHLLLITIVALLSCILLYNVVLCIIYVSLHNEWSVLVNKLQFWIFYTQIGYSYTLISMTVLVMILIFSALSFVFFYNTKSYV